MINQDELQIILIENKHLQRDDSFIICSWLRQMPYQIILLLIPVAVSREINTELFPLPDYRGVSCLFGRNIQVDAYLLIGKKSIVCFNKSVTNDPEMAVRALIYLGGPDAKRNCQKNQQGSRRTMLRKL